MLPTARVVDEYCREDEYHCPAASYSYIWPADVSVPNVLPHYDLPELIDTLPCGVAVLNPLDGAGNPLPAQPLEALNGKIGNRVFVPNADGREIAASVQSLLA